MQDFTCPDVNCNVTKSRQRIGQHVESAHSDGPIWLYREKLRSQLGD